MTETFVIGAGPYGISLATHLRARQVPFEIVGEPMQSWRKHMPPGMVLKSEPFASSLWDPDRVHSLEKFCELRGASYDAIGTPVPLYKFLSYADWFQQQAKLDIRNRTLVRLARTAAGFDLTFADGERMAARRVVLATGSLPYRFVPPVLRELPAELASHSADHSDLGRFAGRDVTIVGSGQSGLETAALLHEQGATTRVLARAPRIYWNDAPQPHRSVLSRARWPDSGLGTGWRTWIYAERPELFYRLPAQLRARIVATNWGPAGSWWIKQRLMDKVPLLTGHEIVAAQERGGRLRLTVRGGTDIQTFDTDHVIAATGYKVDLNGLPLLDHALRAAIAVENGAPRLSASFESSVPGLYFIGAASAQSFGPVMRFMFGAKHPARTLATHFATQAKISPAAARAPGRMPGITAQADRNF
jgi:cation diffusion facilitator CzcD-associated flavoprotein CzcO